MDTVTFYSILKIVGAKIYISEMARGLEATRRVLKHTRRESSRIDGPNKLSDNCKASNYCDAVHFRMIQYN